MRFYNLSGILDNVEDSVIETVIRPKFEDGFRMNKKVSWYDCSQGLIQLQLEKTACLLNKFLVNRYTLRCEKNAAIPLRT